MVIEDKSLIFKDLDGLLNYQGYQVEIADTSPLVHFLKVCFIYTKCNQNWGHYFQECILFIKMTKEVDRHKFSQISGFHVMVIFILKLKIFINKSMLVFVFSKKMVFFFIIASLEAISANINYITYNLKAFRGS